MKLNPKSKVPPTPLEIERQRRICVSIWAYAYEELCASIVDDATFDRVCREIDVEVSTDNPEMDAWFKKHFDPSTGSWVGSHPYPEVLRNRAIRLLTSMGITYFDNRARTWVHADGSKEPEANIEKVELS